MNSYNDGVEITVIEDENEKKSETLESLLKRNVPRQTQIRLPDNLQYDKDKKPLTCHRCKWPPKYLNRE